MPITNFANNTVKIDLQGHGSIVQTRRVKNLCHVKKRPDCCIWKEGRNPTRLADYHFPQQRRQGYNIRGAVTIGFTAKSIAKTRPNYYYTCHGFQTLMKKKMFQFQTFWSLDYVNHNFLLTWQSNFLKTQCGWRQVKL